MRECLSRVLVATALALVAGAAPGCHGRSGGGALTTIEVPVSGERAITGWHVVGPFPNDQRDKGGKKLESPEEYARASAGLGTDYLRRFGVPEARVDASSFPTLAARPYAQGAAPEGLVSEVRAGAVLDFFPFLAAAGDFASVYAGAILESAEEGPAALLFGTNDFAKIWVNGQVAFSVERGRGVREHDEVAVLPLRKGKNFLLVKVTNLRKEWGFTASVADLATARKVGTREKTNWNVMPEIALARGQALKLNPLYGFEKSGEVSVTDSAGRVWKRAALPEVAGGALDLGTLADGLYKVRVTSDTDVTEQSFFFGEIQKVADGYRRALAALPVTEDGARITLESLILRFEHLLKPESRDKTKMGLWPRKVLWPVEQIEAMLATRARGEDGLGVRPGSALRSFRSKIDGSVQNYLFYMPEGVSGRPPLVLHVPSESVPLRPYTQSVWVADSDQIRMLTALATKLGFAIVQPAIRGNSNGSDIAMADIEEVLADLQQHLSWDEERFYLLGRCAAGRDGLTIAERWPSRFAAAAVLEPVTARHALIPSQTEETLRALEAPHSPPRGERESVDVRAALAGSDPRQLAGNLRNVPVFIHNELYEEQREGAGASADAFIEAAKTGGVTVSRETSILGLPINVRYDRVLSFFVGKRRNATPERVSLTTNQLKYGSAYWLTLTRLSHPLELARVDARRAAPGRIEISATGVEQLQISCRALGWQKGPLTVSVNGQVAYEGTPAGDVVSIRVAGSKSANAEAAGPAKSSEVEGPLSHALSRPFLVVDTGAGAKGTVAPAVASFASSWKGTFFGDVPVKHASEVTEADLAEHSLVLIGPWPAGNTLPAKMVKLLPVAVGPDEIEVAGQRFQGEGLGLNLVWPNPLQRGRYVAYLGGTKPEALRYHAGRLALEGWYDFLVYRTGPGRPETLAAGRFDAAWAPLAGATISRNTARSR